MSLPVAVTFISAVIGNILGYTLIKNYVAGMYYNSYSLTPYTTRWNGKAFIQTTVIPIIIMFFVNFIMIRTKLRFSPLQFLKRDFKKKRSRGSLKLPSRIPFFTRFRIRVFFQNIGNYIVLFVGILSLLP
jgi:putative ABC transport system permease protein